MIPKFRDIPQLVSGSGKGRTGHTSAVTSNKIWIFGGWGIGTYYNDVWFSE
jgi:hypothetical protein